ncbi:hypothetical protein [Ectothiorhodospira shaposhnikovii]|uniref:hypothetical protein n=1 Tax=Ectothiorhodospira shaposhnikovii TaxID=1054 RepID=UPI0039A365EC
MAELEAIVRELSDTDHIPLTTLSHGDGCGCKIAPAVLQEALRGLTQGVFQPNHQ